MNFRIPFIALNISVIAKHFSITYRRDAEVQRIALCAHNPQPQSTITRYRFTERLSFISTSAERP